MKKYILPIIILIAFIVLIAYFYFNKFNFNDEIDHNANRLSTEVENSTGLNNDISKEPVVVEEEISSFSTKIIDDDDKSRYLVNVKRFCQKQQYLILFELMTNQPKWSDVLALIGSILHRVRQ